MPVINRLRSIREEQGLSQGELAAIMGVSRQTINPQIQSFIRVGITDCSLF